MHGFHRSACERFTFGPESQAALLGAHLVRRLFGKKVIELDLNFLTSNFLTCFLGPFAQSRQNLFPNALHSLDNGPKRRLLAQKA